MVVSGLLVTFEAEGHDGYIVPRRGPREVKGLGAPFIAASSR